MLIKCCKGTTFCISFNSISLKTANIRYQCDTFTRQPLMLQMRANRQTTAQFYTNNTTKYRKIPIMG